MPPVPPRGSGELVLIADDDADLRSVIASMLVAAGYRVVEAADGRAALEQIDQQRPHLVLLDLVMPQIDGLEVLQRLRKDPRIAETPVVVLSAYSSRLVEARFPGLANGSLAKPFNRHTLLTTVAQVLHGAAPEVEG